MEFSRQEYWNELPFPSPGDLPNPGSPALQADALPYEPPGNTVEVTDRFRGLYLIDRVPEKLWMEARDVV